MNDKQDEVNTRYSTIRSLLTLFLTVRIEKLSMFHMEQKGVERSTHF